MPEESKNKRKYGVAEIESYYNGKLTPQEMHELEKAALEDSFLADAMEGYTHTSTPGADVTNLKSRFQERQKNKGLVISIDKKKSIFNLFKVAALFLLIAGTGWIIYEFALNKRGTDISYNEKSQIPGSETNSDRDTVNDQTQISQLPETSTFKVDKKTEPKTTRVANSTKSKIQENKKLSEDIVEKKEISNAPAQLEGNKEATVMTTPHGETFSTRQLPQHDSTYSAKRSSLGKIENLDNNKIEIKNNGNQVIITIKETQDGVKELVLKRAKTDIIVKKKPSIIIEEAEPEESWSEFGQYISENLPENFLADTLKGTVKLSFDVNSSGKPVNIHVEKSLCEKCDAEALKLLEEGPKWKRKTKRGKVSFLF